MTSLGPAVLIAAALAILAFVPTAEATNPVYPSLCESADAGPVHVGIAVNIFSDTCANACTGTVNVVVGVSVWGDVHNCDQDGGVFEVLQTRNSS